MAFYVDDVLWNVYVKKTDVYYDYRSGYMAENQKKIPCDLDSDRNLQVHGAEPEIDYYRIEYSDDDVAYMLDAQWFLEDEGYMIALRSYSEEPIHTMPVEVFK